MATAKFFVMLVLLALGCALLICANEPRQVTAVWVGGVHDANFSAREPLNTTQRNGARS